jgi:Fe2+ or Zn2+ uptake regulation protein
MADHKKRFEIIIQKLRANGQKITPQRLAIVQILAKSTGHPSVEDIHDQIKKDFPTMSLATVYRNIVLIKSLGQVLELGFPVGLFRYLQQLHGRENVIFFLPLIDNCYHLVSYPFESKARRSTCPMKMASAR